MFSNNIQSFIILTIYVLIIANVLLLFAIYYEIIKDILKQKHHARASLLLTPEIIGYIENDSQKAAVEKLLTSHYLKMTAIDIMIDYGETHHVNLSEKFEALNFVSLLIKKLEKETDIVYLKKLALMRSEQAYDILMKLSQSDDLDKSYMSFFGLSLIETQSDKKEAAIGQLIRSNILRDRSIEILRQFDLSFYELLELLEKEESVKGKVIFIKVLMNKDDIKREAYSNRLEKFLEGHREVRIAAIQALSNSQNEKYVSALTKIYDTADSWQVRVAVAKGLSNFKFTCVKDVLLKMTKDSEWWVRYNAIKSIVAMGDDGLFSLIDLSLDASDDRISDLAYYFLNANQDVYNTVKNIEV